MTRAAMAKKLMTTNNDKIYDVNIDALSITIREAIHSDAPVM